MTTDMRHPEVAALVRQQMTVIAAADVPRLDQVRARVVLSRLADTTPGDVFFLAKDPSIVWENCPVHDGDEYCFTMNGFDCWYTLADVGTGRGDQVIVIIHNTRKFLPSRPL